MKKSLVQDVLTQKVVARRKFLVGAAALTAALALAAAFPSEMTEFQPSLTPLTNMIALDFVGAASSPGHIRYSYLAAFDEAKRLLGPDAYIPLWRLVLEFGPDVFTEAKFKKNVIARYPAYGLIVGGLFNFTTHGASVIACHERFAHTLGYAPTPLALPVQDALQVLDLHYHDNLNNPAVLVKVAVDPLIGKLRQHPNRPIVNLSLQVGSFALIDKRTNVYPTYDDSYTHLREALLTHYTDKDPTDGNPRYYFYDPFLYDYKENDGHAEVISKATGEPVAVGAAGYVEISAAEYGQFVTERKNEVLRQSLHLEELQITPFYEIRGAYTGEFGAENIQELFRLVNAFPKKLFVVAAGNYGDDLRPLRQRFAAHWPANLLIVGYWDNTKQYPQMYDTYNIFGADLYFDGLRYGLHTGSSMSTAVVSAAASILWQRGYALPTIKTVILASCDEVEIETKPYVPIGSTSIEDYIEAELHKRKEKVKVFNEAKFKKNIAQFAA